MNYFNSFFFGVFPYIALTVAILGSFYRFKYQSRGVKTHSSQILASKSLKIGSILFHIGIVNLALGHIFGLSTPHVIYEAFGLTTPMKQMLEIVMGLAMTPITLLGLSILIWRRVADARVRANNAKGDVSLLVLLWIQIALGASTISSSIHHLDGSMMLQITGWFQGMMTFQPDVWHEMVTVPMVYKLHIILGFVFFLILPFTRLIHVVAGPAVIQFITRPYQIVRQGVWVKK